LKRGLFPENQNRWLSPLSKEKRLAEVSWAGDNLFIGSDDEGHSVVYDSSNDEQKGISPMRGLLTSLGACTGMDIVAILGKRRQKLTSLKVFLTGEQPEHGYPKPWQSISVRYLIGGEKLERKYVEEAVSDSMAKFCSVAASLRPTAKISYSYEIKD
jgi:putative redox protein